MRTEPDLVRAKHLPHERAFVEEGRLTGDFCREGAWHGMVIFSIFREARVD